MPGLTKHSPRWEEEEREEEESHFFITRLSNVCARWKALCERLFFCSTLVAQTADGLKRD